MRKQRSEKSATTLDPENNLNYKIPMSVPSQDLVFFKNHSLIPDSILSSEKSYLSIITHSQGTNPSWLINCLVENAIYGTASFVNQDLKKRAKLGKVVLFSFLHNESHYSKGIRKNGVTLPDSNFKFVDCFSNLFTERIENPENASKDVLELFDVDIDQGSVVFVEAPETLLFSTNVSSDELLTALLKLNKKASQLFVVVSKDEQLVDYNSNEVHNPAFKITDFITKLLFRSHLNITMEPLSTGRAKDITGSIVVSKGAIPFDDLIVEEKSYVYNITKDANVKIFYR